MLYVYEEVLCLEVGLDLLDYWVGFFNVVVLVVFRFLYLELIWNFSGWLIVW